MVYILKNRYELKSIFFPLLKVTNSIYVNFHAKEVKWILVEGLGILLLPKEQNNSTNSSKCDLSKK